MDTMFNAAEHQVDNELTIAALKTMVNSLNVSIAELTAKNSEQSALIEALRAELVDAKQANEVLSAKLEAPSSEAVIQQAVINSVSRHLDEYLANTHTQDMIRERLDEVIRDMLDGGYDIDVTEAVERAIDEALSNVRISFR